MVVRATPPFWPLVRHAGGQTRTGVGTPFAPLCPPCGEVALTTVIPGGKAIERAFALMVDECVSM